MPAEVESMFYTGKTPWHGLGVALEQPPSAAEAIQAAGLDWEVEKREIWLEDAEEPIDDWSAVVRGDTEAVLGVVGKTWRPLQNRDAFAFFDPFVHASAAEYHTAGSLKAGRYVWVLAKLAGDPMQVAKNDVVEKYLLLSNSHDGKAAINVRFTPVRVVCWNTLTMAESDNASPFLRIPHKGDVRDTLRRVQEVVDVTNRTFAATLEQYRFLASRQVENIHKYVLDVLQVPDDAEEPPRALAPIVQLFEHGRGQENRAIRGTYWAAYNAMTEFVDHERGRDNTRLHAAWYGEGRRIKQRALSVATELAKAA
jgi:phage/plasmid-like protein (TIGR03299 family)